MILAVMNTIILQLCMEAWKIQDFNGVRTHDLAILVQLSYEEVYSVWQSRYQEQDQIDELD